MKRAIFILMMLSVSAFASYTYTVTDGMDFGGLTLTGTQSLLMTGGGGGILNIYDYSYVKIENTAPYNQSIAPRGGIEKINIDPYGKLFLAGGEINEVNMSTFATAVLYGGKISRLKTSQFAWKTVGQPPVQVWNPHVEIICREYNYSTTTKMLTGLWDVDADNNGLYDPFNIQLVDVAGYSPTIDNIKFTVPEPATMLLLALGGLLIRRK